MLQIPINWCAGVIHLRYDISLSNEQPKVQQNRRNGVARRYTRN